MPRPDMHKHTVGHAHALDMQMSPGKLPCAQHRPEAVRVPRTAQLRPCCGTAYVSAQSIRRRRPRRSARPRRPDGSQAGACRWRGRGRRAHRRLSPHRVRYRWSTWKRSSSRKRALRGSCYSGCRNPAGFFKGANLTNHGPCAWTHLLNLRRYLTAMPHRASSTTFLSSWVWPPCPPGWPCISISISVPPTSGQVMPKCGVMHEGCAQEAGSFRVSVSHSG